SEASTSAISESGERCSITAWALARATSNGVPPSLLRARRRMLAESSSTTTALCERPVTAGRSERTSANGRAKASGSAIASPVRASSRSASRSRRRAETSRSARRRSSIAAKRTGRARRRPMRWMSAGSTAASRPSRSAGARKCTGSLPSRPLAREEKRAQDVGRRIGRGGELVLDTRLDAGPPPALAQRRRLALERGGQIARVDQQPPPVVGLHRLEVGHLVEGERDLVRVEDLEQRHVVPAGAELPQPIGQ